MRQRRIVLGVVLGVVATALVVAVLLALPAQPQVACPPFVGPRGPATHTDGPLAITTDASVYASDGVLTVTVTSHLGNPI